MKTNGSMIRRRGGEGCQGDELRGHPCSRPCLICSHTPRTRVLLSARRIRQAALHVNQVLPAGWKSSWNIQRAGKCRNLRWVTASGLGVAAASPMAPLTPVFAVSRSSPPGFVLTLPCALFALLYFTVFLPIRHVEKSCRRNRSEPGTGYLNPLMGSMGYAALLEH